MLEETQVFEILKALADANRLQLFQLLLNSDHTNSELMSKTQLSQNLLSHHLNVLVQCDLVRIHQSVGDARRHYYSVNLATTRAFGDWWQRAAVAPTPPLPTLHRPRRVLFLCMQNGFRSLVAEALARHRLPDTLIPASAGLEPATAVSDLLPQTLAQYGVPTDGLYSKTVHELDAQPPFDLIVTVCDLAHERAALPDSLQAVPDYRHWSICDPKQCADHPGDTERLAHEIFAELDLRLALLVSQLAQADA